MFDMRKKNKRQPLQGLQIFLPTLQHPWNMTLTLFMSLHKSFKQCLADLLIAALHLRPVASLSPLTVHFSKEERLRPSVQGSIYLAPKSHAGHVVF